MIEQCGRIVALSPDQVTVRIERKLACQTCVSGKGCGSNAMRWFGSEAFVVNVRRDPQQCAVLQVNDPVVVGLPEQGLLAASLLLYGLPLAFMLSTALWADLSGISQWLIVVMSLLAGCAGFWLARQLQSTFVHQLQPIFLHKQNDSIAIESTLT